MEDSIQGSSYLNSCKVQLINYNIKSHDKDNNMCNIDKLRLSFLEEELKHCTTRLSAYEKSTSFILAQLHLINKWIESNFDSHRIIDTSSDSYQNWMKSYNMDRITSIAKEIKYLSSNSSTGCAIAINQEETRDVNALTCRKTSASDLSVEDVYPETNRPQYEEGEEEQMNINISHQENEIQDLVEPNQSCHGIDSGTGMESTPEIPESSSTTLEAFSCHRCTKKFSTFFQLNKHIRTHSNQRPYKCQQCSVKFTLYCNLKNHLKYVHIKDAKYNCKYCSKSFTRYHALVDHEHRHKGEKPYSCTTCYKKFITHWEQIQHERTHSKEKLFKCTFCGETFGKKSSLTNHISNHTGERPYACTSCDKTFVSHFGLKQHEGTHETEKHFPCNLCDKKYSSKRSKKRHESIHSDQHLVYNCTLCTKAFNNKWNWERHIQSHTKEKPFKCEICSKSFARKRILKDHGNTHIQAKLYNCEVCSKSFTFKSSLHNHKEVHSGKTYTCKYCNKVMKSKKGFKGHMKECQIRIISNSLNVDNKLDEALV